MKRNQSHRWRWHLQEKVYAAPSSVFVPIRMWRGDIINICCFPYCTLILRGLHDWDQTYIGLIIIHQYYSYCNQQQLLLLSESFWASEQIAFQLSCFVCIWISTEQPWTRCFALCIPEEQSELLLYVPVHVTETELSTCLFVISVA